MKDENNKRKSIAMIGAFVMVPFLFAIPPSVGWLIGQWLDQRFGTEPILAFLCIAMGFATGIREVYKIIKRFGDFS